MRVKKEIYGYRKKRSSDSQVIDRIDVHMPPLVYDTLAMWVSIPPIIRDEVSGAGWAMERGGLHAIEHLLITLCQPFSPVHRHHRFAGTGTASYFLGPIIGIFNRIPLPRMKKRGPLCHRCIKHMLQIKFRANRKKSPSIDGQIQHRPRISGLDVWRGWVKPIGHIKERFHQIFRQSIDQRNQRIRIPELPQMTQILSR